MNLDEIRKVPNPPSIGRKRLSAPRRLLALATVLAMAVLLAATIAILGLAGNNAPRSGKPTGQAQLRAAAANANPEVPGDGTATATAMATAVATSVSTGVATEEPDATETPIPIDTAQPSRTRAATVTRIPSAVRTMTEATHIAYATRVVTFRQELRTAAALTHAPTVTPGRPPSQPSPTPAMGMLEGCGNVSSNGPQATNCWRGVLDGEIVEVYAGREGRDGDRTQGVVWVYVRGQSQQGVEIYSTPQRVGAVQIVSVDEEEMLVTLETVTTGGQPTPQATPQVFVFDLDARQWGSP